MIFKRIEPSPSITHWVECFWIIENDDPKQVIQKIIPDGFPEIIFHFGQPYEISLNGRWERQSENLVAGQIRKYFWLRNTGQASMLGIKLKPSALSHIIHGSMRNLTDKVEDLGTLTELCELLEQVRGQSLWNRRIEEVESFFQRFSQKTGVVEKALEMIFNTSGMNSVNDLVESLGISERQLERLFNECVGMGPKFYSRVIRFSTIFQLKERGDHGWLDLTHEAGFADQSHFIRNFKAFTGEDPTRYGFDEKNMANFFLKKK